MTYPPVQNIKHPIAERTNVKFQQATCPCTGNDWIIVEGQIRRIIEVNGKFNYLMFSGKIVQQDNIIEVIK